MARSSWARDPGSCMPVSISTTPDPAAIAQALPCGTPGHGSGSRRRHRPGSTRSPRPSSRWALISSWVQGRAGSASVGRGSASGRAGSASVGRYSRRVDCAAPMASATEIAKRYFEALNAHDLDRATALWAPDAVDRFVGDQEVIGPEGVRGYFSALFAAFPDFSLEVLESTTSRQRTAVR